MMLTRDSIFSVSPTVLIDSRIGPSQGNVSSSEEMTTIVAALQEVLQSLLASANRVVDTKTLIGNAYSRTIS